MKYRRFAGRILCLAAIIACSIGTVWSFSRQLQRTLTDEIYWNLSQVSEDYNRAFLDHLAYSAKALKVLSGGLQEISPTTQDDVVRILRSAVKDGEFIKVAVCSPQGLSYSSEGSCVDVSHRDYFQRAMAGETNVSQPLTSLVTGEASIVIAVPIQAGGAVTGVLLGVYPLTSAGKQLLDFTYYSEGYGFIVTPDGGIVLSSEHTDRLCAGENLFSFFEQAALTDVSLPSLQAAIAKGEGGHFSFSYQGQRRFVSFTPTGTNHWYTFSIASDKLMLQQGKVTNQIVFRLILKLALVGVLLLAWIVLGNRRHNRALLAASQRYQSLLAHINGGMVVTTHGQSVEQIIATYVSDGFTAMTGYTLAELQGAHQGRYLELLPEEDRQAAFQQHLEQVTQGSTYRVSYRIRKKDGTLLWVIDNGYLVEDEDGLHNHSILTDLTLIRQQEEALRLSENRFSVAINASSGTLFEVDLKNKRYTHFENAQRIFGVSAQQLLADTQAFSVLPYDGFLEATTQYFFHPDDCTLARDAMGKAAKNGTASYEARLRRFDGSYLWARIDLSLTLDAAGVPARLVGFMSDIDAIKQQAALLEREVQADPMTGLYHKVAMATLANQVLREHSSGRHALLVLDIDNFKGINDTLGHAFGDLVLIEIASKLKLAFRANDLVGRMGGDEFAVLLRDVPNTNGALKQAAELSAALRQTYAGEKGDYKISCSIGIIMADDRDDSFELLYRKADAALYRAKENGKDQFVLYQPQEAARYPTGTTRTNDEELQNLKTSHSMEAQIFELLYTAKDFHVSVRMALAAIGQHYQVSRVAIFENNEANTATSAIYEWCNSGVTPQLDNIQNMPFSDGVESVLDCFDQNGLLYCNNVSELPAYPRRLLGEQGVLSTLKVSIVNDEKVCGFIGFDECHNHRAWKAEEIENLTFLAKVLSVFLFKQQVEAALLANLHTRLKILDALPDYICVVNPQTHTVEYSNGKMQALLPQSQHGAFCFTTLRGGQAGPCEVCLLELLRRGEVKDLEIVSADHSLHLAVNAISIVWTNDQEMVLLYGLERGNA